jgi:predicted house-cleaning noncanonical NTP pyrophosphatase (MazG superfamily)
MELLIEAGLLERDRLEKLITEANQLVAMTVASINTAKNKMKNRKSERASEFINSEIRNPKSEIS